MTPPLPHPELSLALVLPCFNEARRLPAGALRIWLDRLPRLSLILVDDGSTDDTPTVIRDLARHPRVQAVFLPENLGKAEAVRHGLLHALHQGTDAVGFWDADLAAPLHHLPIMLQAMAQPGIDACLGVRPLWRADRTLLRRGLGNAGRFLLRNSHTPDPQCGAKLFRSAPHHRAVLSEPLRHRWLFDLELMERLDLRGPALHTLDDWRDVPDSRLAGRQWAVLVWELMRLRTPALFPQRVRRNPHVPHPTPGAIPEDR